VREPGRARRPIVPSYRRQTNLKKNKTNSSESWVCLLLAFLFHRAGRLSERFDRLAWLALFSRRGTALSTLTEYFSTTTVARCRIPPALFLATGGAETASIQKAEVSNVVPRLGRGILSFSIPRSGLRRIGSNRQISGFPRLRALDCTPVAGSKKWTRHPSSPVATV